MTKRFHFCYWNEKSVDSGRKVTAVIYYAGCFLFRRAGLCFLLLHFLLHCNSFHLTIINNINHSSVSSEKGLLPALTLHSKLVALSQINSLNDSVGYNIVSSTECRVVCGLVAELTGFRSYCMCVYLLEKVNHKGLKYRRLLQSGHALLTCLLQDWTRQSHLSRGQDDRWCQRLSC